MDSLIRKEIAEVLCQYEKMHDFLKAVVKDTPSKLGCISKLKKFAQEVFIAKCSAKIITHVFDYMDSEGLDE